MKQPRHYLSGLAALAVTAAIIPGCEQKEEAKALPPPDVLVVAAATEDVPVYREWIGTLDGSENAEIRARVTGYLLKRNYAEGSLVKKGDVLFEIDPRPFDAALAEAKSALEQAKAMQLASQAEAERSAELFSKKVISEKEYTNKTQLNESSIAKVKALEANVEQAKLNLEFCKITAPVDGIAGIAQAQVGDLVGTGSNTVLTQVSTLDPVKITFPVSEADYLLANKRVQETLSKPMNERPKSMEIILADGSVFPEKAQLLAVDRQVQATTGTIRVTALLPNPGSVLRPGFYARAKIESDRLKDAVIVPQRALAEVQGSYQLGIVKDGKAEIRPVKVGARTGSKWVITSGLAKGEKVIVEGLQKVKAGTPVNEKPWSETPAPKSEDSKTPATTEAKPEGK